MTTRRAWTWLYLARRRRARAIPAPDFGPLPEVTLSNGAYATEQYWYNTSFEVAVDLKAWPSGSIEIWGNTNENGYQLLATVPADTSSYVHRQAAVDPTTALYKARYVNNSNFGPFSPELEIDLP